MRTIAADAMRAGAFGFSPSRTIGHKTLAGDPIPTLRAAERELTEIALGMADAGHGVLEVISDWDAPDPDSEFAMLRRVVEASGRPALISVTQRYHQPAVWGRVMELARDAAADGLPMRTVVAPRSEEHTSELQSLMRISYAVFCLKKKTTNNRHKD